MKKPSKEEIIAAIHASMCDDEYIGYCTSCWEEAYGVEPHARGYTCEYCGAPDVVGAEELMLVLMELAV